jgi:hypothetical protein
VLKEGREERGEKWRGEGNKYKRKEQMNVVGLYRKANHKSYK